MKLEHARAMINFLHQMGEHGAKLYEGYSGRGMYGDTTVGVKTEWHPDDVEDEILAYNKKHDFEEEFGIEADVLIGYRADSLGMRYIIY